MWFVGEYTSEEINVTVDATTQFSKLRKGS